MATNLSITDVLQLPNPPHVEPAREPVLEGRMMDAAQASLHRYGCRAVS